ncbi:MAG: hypothetical protein AAFO87_16075, partial [Cyanobacteria bacterium J06607_6]
SLTASRAARQARVPDTAPKTPKPQRSHWGFSGTLACLAALEAVKLLTGLGEPLTGQLLTMDLARAEFAKRRPYHDPNCVVCGPLSRERLSDRPTEVTPIALC